MIPKVAFFHWDGPPMPWLRTVSIATFAKFNPDWEIRLIRNDPRLKDAPMIVQQKADLSWWLALYEHGGFQVATDIIFVAPVPDEWCDAELCCCTKGSEGVWQFAMLGAVKGNPFIGAAAKLGLEMSEKHHFGYQDYGTDLLQGLHHQMGPHRELPMEALCAYDDNWCQRLWDREHALSLPGAAIGVHWYGGHSSSLQHEKTAGPHSDFPIVKLANSVFP